MAQVKNRFCTPNTKAMTEYGTRNAGAMTEYRDLTLNLEVGWRMAEGKVVFLPVSEWTDVVEQLIVEVQVCVCVCVCVRACVCV